MSIDNPKAPPGRRLIRRALTATGCFALVSVGVAASATTRTVPTDLPTIQAAVNASATGDTVNVIPGTYTIAGDFNVTLGSKNLTIQSTGGAAVTVLDNSGGSRANQKCSFIINGGQNRSTVIKGFTIKNSVRDTGGAIAIIDSAATVTQCVFVNNFAPAEGGAIAVVSNGAASGALITQCSFYSNTAGNLTDSSGFGGAIGCEVLSGSAAQNVEISNCVFSGNLATYDGGAIDILGSTATNPTVDIVNCTFNKNNASGYVAPTFVGLIPPPSAGHQPGTIDIFGGRGAVTNSILFGDASPTEISTLSPGVTATFSDIAQAGVSGTGNINQNPQFLDSSNANPALDNLHVTSTSPVISTGKPSGQAAGVLAAVPTIEHDGLLRHPTPDMGAYEVQTPVANPQSVGTLQGAAVAITLTGSDANTPPRSLTYTVATNPAHGTLSGTAPNLTYTPSAGYSGPDSFTFTVNNGNYTSPQATVTISVTHINQPPTIDTIGNLAIGQNAGLQIVNLTGIGPGAGDAGQTLTVTASSSNTSVIPNPTVTYTSPNSTGSLSFTPVTNATGTATITVTVKDNGGTANGAVDTKTTTFNVVVSVVVLAPTANSQSVSTLEDTAKAITLTGSDPNTPAKPLTYSVATNPAHGTLSGTAPNLTYTPNAGYFGPDSFTFTVNNGSLTSTPATVSITVTRVNHIPTIGAIGDQNVAENSGSHSVNLSAISAGVGDGDQTITVTATSDNPSLIPNPTVTYTSPNSIGSLSFTPAANAFGTANITVTVKDNGGTANGGVDTKTVTFQITVTEVVLTPTANNQSVSTAQNTAKAITLTGSDPNTPAKPLTYAVATSPAHGTLSGAAPNLTYTPNAGYFGPDSFTFTVNNGTSTSAAATVSITVTQSAATNVTPQITVTRGGYVYIRATGHYRQSITLTNTGGALSDPLSLVLDSLTGAMLTNATGTTAATTPSGSPYINALGLAAGASVVVVLEFSNQPSGYTTRVLAGAGAR
ncbi:MAG: Ig-like domain-containing protein [Capsulimonas sp.]|uniref:beta strand repeat-containing protein n=1 Tax=Capsulimonas sp. TaxID=2494211 RepID=UPI00326412B7